MNTVQNKTILLAEDDANVREISAFVLEAEGYRVVTASNGTQALELLALDPSVDLVVSDINMPGGMDGIALARHVLRRRPPLRIMLISGYPRDCFPDFPAEVAFLRKPHDRRTLLNAIDASLRSERTEPEDRGPMVAD
jgi:CheY-like chemotaxis protein